MTRTPTVNKLATFMTAPPGDGLARRCSRETVAHPAA
jgi:hypothetical protein